MHNPLPTNLAPEWVETDDDEFAAWLDRTAEIELERAGETYYPTPCDFAHLEDLA